MWFLIPVSVPCVFRLHAWGDTLEEAFEQCAMAMFGYMTDTGTVEPVDTVEVEAEGEDCTSPMEKAPKISVFAHSLSAVH